MSWVNAQTLYTVQVRASTGEKKNATTIDPHGMIFFFFFPVSSVALREIERRESSVGSGQRVKRETPDLAQ